MPANDFGTAIYTNCAAGQGLDGIAGMQFQSRSPGVSREALAVIRRHLIYEPPARLIQDRQPVTAFPPSFAHVHEGLFATAAGVYIGQEAQGTRQGNHLTHAVVTDDAWAYRSVRPVQLFGAPFWRRAPADAKQSERVGPAWQPGPLDAERAGQFVRDQPDGPVLLSVILTALLAHVRRQGDTSPRRVLFISERADEVLLWLTAATLLIPQQEAVRLGFKVFTTDPAHSALPVVAVHPDWVTSAATVEHDRGYVVFDLVSHRWTALTASTEAGHWARWFCQADPYEVSEAVELAAASGLREEAGRQLAAVAVLRQPPPAHDAEALVRWLHSGPPALREAYGGTLAGSLAELPDLRLLREVDSDADRQFPGRRDQIRLRLLQLELDTALRKPMVFQPDRPRRPVSAVIRPEVERLTIETLRRARGSGFDAVLRVANRFEVPVPPEAVREAAAEFVKYWVANPDMEYEPSAWPPSLQLIAMLRDELSARIPEEPDLADQWYARLPSWTPDQADLTSPLEVTLLAAAMARCDPPRRMRIVRSMLSRPVKEFPGGYRGLAGLLWKRATPRTDELRELCDVIPAGQDLGRLFDAVLSGALGDPAQLPELELCGRLAEKRLLELDQATTRALAEHYWLHEFEQRARSWEAPDADDRLLALSPGILNAHDVPLARALLNLRDLKRVVHLLSHLPVPVILAYLRAAGRYSVPNAGPADVARMVVACASLGVWPHDPGPARGGDPPQDSNPVAEECYAVYRSLLTWCNAVATKRDISAVARQVGSVDGALKAYWDRYAAAAKRGQLWHGLDEPDR